MGNKRGPRNIGPEKFLLAWQFAGVVELTEACIKEASRQINELESWMKDQVEYDPWGISWTYEDEIFPMIKKAIRYRFKIYNLGKKIKQGQQKLIEISALRHGGRYDAAFDADEEVISIRKVNNDLEADQMALVWRIKKIHTAVKKTVRVDLAQGEEDPFKEYEYDPETS